MRSLEQSLQSKRSILLGKRKILGKYLQGNQSYLKWNHPLCLGLQCTHANAHTHTHTFALNVLTKLRHRHRYTHNWLFLQTQSSFFWTDQCCSPAARPTDTLVYFSHAHFKFQHFPPPTKKGLCEPSQEDKKVGKYQQVVIYIRTKTNKRRRKELLRRSTAFFCTRNPSHVASGSLPAKSNMDLYTKKVLSLT